MEQVVEKKMVKKAAKPTSVRKSKITLYWEDRERRGIPRGTIYNMRAVLK
jgi:hypothetical protein